MQALQDKGVKVPEDIAVVGYDNIQMSRFTNPGLTTVSQNTKLAGEALVVNLLKLINGGEAESQLMPVELVIRQSCGSH